MSDEYKLLNFIYFWLTFKSSYSCSVEMRSSIYIANMIIAFFAVFSGTNNSVKHCKNTSKNQTQIRSGPGEKFSAIFLEEMLKLTTFRFKWMHPFIHNFINQRYSSYSVMYDEQKESGRMYLVYYCMSLLEYT